MSYLFNTLIVVPFINILVSLINIAPGHSAAVAIIVFTILVRLVLLIPNKHAIESQKKMQALQPEMDEIRKQYPDQQEQAKALMDLYQKNNISPFGSCLPILVQLPILIALYKILQEGFGDHLLAQLYPFVARPEVIGFNFFGLNLSQPDATLILPVLAIGLQLLQSLSLMFMGLKRGQKPQGLYLILFFTFLTFFVAIKVNAGVVLYWVTSTIFGIIQQLIVGKHRVRLVHSELPEKPANSAPIKPAKTEAGKSGVQLTVRRPDK